MSNDVSKVLEIIEKRIDDLTEKIITADGVDKTFDIITRHALRDVSYVIRKEFI